MQRGRTEIFTSVPEITDENVTAVLQEAMLVHETNKGDMDYLLNYEAGNQPLARTKTYRADINCECVDNVANEVAEFKEGFHWGNPITLVQNGTDGSNRTKDIEKLNEQYELDGTAAKIQEIGRFTEIVGVCNEYIDINQEYAKGESYFTTIPLDPRFSFIVKSSYYQDKRKMMGVTYRVDGEGNKYYTCITKNRRYEIVENVSNNSGGKKGELTFGENGKQVNPFGIINMVEWIRYCDRTGCFERQISDMDNLNLLISDFTNDVDQNTQAIWHGNDIEFPTDENGNEEHPQTNDWLVTQTTPDGKQPFVKPLAVEYDYEGMLANILSRRSLILQKCKVPQRNDNSGGSTGIAMSDATGWSEAEMVASKQQPLQERSKMEEVKIVLAVINTMKESKGDPIRKLTAGNMKPNIKRQKTYEMTTKINALATGLSHGIFGADMLAAVNLFDDPNAVWEHSKETIKAYQDKLVKTNETPGGQQGEQMGVGGAGEQEPDKGRLSPDPSDQIANSPMIEH